MGIRVHGTEGRSFEVTLEPEGEKKSLCKRCNAPLRWAKTAKGKNMPLDALGADDAGIWTSHYETCPNAAEFRGQGQKARQGPSQPPGSTQGPRPVNLVERDALIRLDGLEFRLAALEARVKTLEGERSPF